MIMNFLFNADFCRPPDVGKNSNFGPNNPKTPPMVPEDDDILRYDLLLFILSSYS